MFTEVTLWAESLGILRTVFPKGESYGNCQNAEKRLFALGLSMVSQLCSHFGQPLRILLNINIVVRLFLNISSKDTKQLFFRY